MADTQIKTTSSKALEESNDKAKAAPLPPSSGKAQILTKLAQNLSESYQIVKRRQQKYNELSSSNNSSSSSIGAITKHAASDANNDDELDDDGGGAWQQVCAAKNKLKRKKKLSTSLTSVTDSVNQEKRTRIEGIQLNCRGRLQLPDLATHTPPAAVLRNQSSKRVAVKVEKPVVKSTTTVTTTTTTTSTTDKQTLTNEATQAAANAAKMPPPPPRLKRKLQENVQTIQKLNALTEQLRLEINELKSSLTTERGAVRVLRAQNESETRKWRNEVKKLQNTLELQKKSNTAMPNSSRKLAETAAEPITTPTATAMSSLANYEIQRLTNEINALKEANKVVEENRMINNDADRRKAADMRTLKDSYEIRLTQLTKSAKTEMTRLLEELKTKERNIGQLKRDLQSLQSKQQQQQQLQKQNEVKPSRNATKKLTTNQTTNQTTIKPKKLNTKNANKKLKVNETATTTTTTTNKEAVDEHIKDASNHAEQPNEMKKLKEIELINNTKNLQNNLNNLKTTTTTLTTTNTKILTNKQQKTTTPENNAENEQNHFFNNENCNSLLMKMTGTTTATTTNTQREYHSMPHELTERLTGTGTGTAFDTKTQASSAAKAKHEYRTKDNNSDSDSALSSAPPSISPQPPPAGLETHDIWQMIRTYTTDIEKLQKEVEMLHKENEELHSELNAAKQQLVEAEKSANIVATKHANVPQLMERIKVLEEQERELQAEADELREQNELLEFRIIELEETNDKWSLQNHAPTAANATPQANSTSAEMSLGKDVWACGKPNKDDPMQMLFGSNAQMDSGITSPHERQQHEDDLNLLLEPAHEDLRQRIACMLKKSTLDADERQCLQQVLSLLQQLDLMSQRSGPNSLNTTTSSSDEASSLDMVKSRISDYSSASSSTSSSARSTYDNVQSNLKSHAASSPAKTSISISTTQTQSTTAPNSRIVATVQPYNSSQQAPTNTPNDSPRKTRAAWQCNSLSESGVFVESDFLSDASEHNVCTQTEFEDISLASAAQELCSELQKLQHGNRLTCKVPAHSPHNVRQHSPQLSDQKRLQYYKERLELLERKVLIYESSGDLQAKRLADRLQREIQLEKELRELQDRVEILEQENSTLEEEKCEFEEAENDTRLRLQRLEVELEILSQRNVELEMSREALSAKYKDCRSECLILRDDLAAGETQIRHLEEDKQKAKENLEFLHSALPLLLIYYSVISVDSSKQQEQQEEATPLHTADDCDFNKMGNTVPCPPPNPCMRPPPTPQYNLDDIRAFENVSETTKCQLREIHYLKEEVKCLRNQIKELNSRHYEAMETADSHWVDLEREYKNREEAYRAKEVCLKQKITKLQDCLREDARAANEKIQQMEESEKELKCCLVRISREHREILEEHHNVIAEYECFKEQFENQKCGQKPLADALDAEKKHCKCLNDEVSFLRKLQQETEAQNRVEIECLRDQLFEAKKELLHIEVTNSELREEVTTLEQQIIMLQNREKDSEDKCRCLQDEVRTKEEMCQKLEKQLERSEGFSLAHELSSSPSKRLKREDVNDLHSASRGLGNALRNVKDCEKALPSQNQFRNVARDVKKLADALLGESSEEEAPLRGTSKLIVTDITRI